MAGVKREMKNGKIGGNVGLDCGFFTLRRLGEGGRFGRRMGADWRLRRAGCLLMLRRSIPSVASTCRRPGWLDSACPRGGIGRRARFRFILFRILFPRLSSLDTRTKPLISLVKMPFLDF